MKNYGLSSAIVTDFSCTLDLLNLAYHPEHVPFSHIVGSNLCPGESLKFPINARDLPNDVTNMEIKIKYKSQSNSYTEHTVINFAPHLDMLHVRANTENEHLKEISFALQDIAEKML